MFGCFDDACQRYGWIVFRPLGAYGVVEYGFNALQYCGRRIQCAACSYSVNNGLHLFDADSVYRLFADGGQYVYFQAALNFGGMGWCPAWQLVGVPFACNVFTSVF